MSANVIALSHSDTSALSRSSESAMSAHMLTGTPPAPAAISLIISLERQMRWWVPCSWRQTGRPQSVWSSMAA